MENTIQAFSNPRKALQSQVGLKNIPLQPATILRSMDYSQGEDMRPSKWRGYMVELATEGTSTPLGFDLLYTEAKRTGVIEKVFKPVVSGEVTAYEPIFTAIGFDKVGRPFWSKQSVMTNPKDVPVVENKPKFE